MAAQCIWIVLLPFLAFLVQVSLGKRLPRHGDFISVLAIVGSLFFAAPIFFTMLRDGFVSDVLNYDWMTLPSATNSHAFVITIGVLVNNLTAIMLFMVTLCASLIHLFSVGYMHGEERYHLFFAYISLFSAAMLLLVVSNNLLTFFIAWELMGLCSYLLIGFYYKKPSANHASLKAFMTTRVGDVCFFLGICGLFYVFGTTQFNEIYIALQKPEFHHATILGFPAFAFIGFMLLMGTIGKSAQFPLHVWLPDAMEGPTPVSALIHAATMVAAGVFLLVRMFPLLDAAHVVLPVVSYVGAITAFMTALLAVVQTDIKKVLAYSTISQLGFMVIGIGVGAMDAGFMHLITHACFKACLFMCSGSVIHAVHTQDMFEMGGLRSKMPLTFLAMFTATLAIAGVPCFSGFVSKDRILGSALAYGMVHPSHMPVAVLGFVTAGITAFYMFRMIFLTFFGHARDEHKHHHAHESPLTMTFPVLVLAGLSLALWYAGPTGFESIDHFLPMKWFDHALEKTQLEMGIGAHHAISAEIHEQAHHMGMLLSLLCAFTGILVSSITYWKRIISADAIKRALSPFHKVLWNKYFLDDLYLKVFIQKGLLNFNWALARFDDLVVDRIFVDGWKDIAMAVKTAVGKFDDIVVDRIFVDGTGNLAAAGGWVLRQIQTGRVQQYLIMSFVLLCLVLMYISRANLG